MVLRPGTDSRSLHIVWHRIGTHHILARPLAEGLLPSPDHRLAGAG